MATDITTAFLRAGEDVLNFLVKFIEKGRDFGRREFWNEGGDAGVRHGGL